jgi:hypothetical protein
VKQHFLAVELVQQDLAAEDAGYLLSHHVESLGRLLEASTLAWSDAEKRRVRGWLAELEQGRFRDVDGERLETLCHLARGLRSVRARRAVLE